MKMETVLALCIGIGIGAFALYVTRPSDPKAVPLPVSLGEVTDLIDRLKPLAYEPEGSWRGVRITFTGAGAEVKITTKDGNEYTGAGKTLNAATTMIDSSRIREALQGWQHSH